MKGSYLLLINLPDEQAIKIGSLNTVRFPDGCYAYLGSAMRGIESRLSHHLQGSKKPHWHIDYLLKRASISSIILCETGEKTECTIAEALSHHFDSIPDFGCSDCRCRSHLFFSARDMKPVIMATLRLLAKTGADSWRIHYRIVK